MYKTVLAIDCAGEILSVALQCDNSIFNTEIDAGAKHSELLLEVIENLISLARIKKTDIDLAVCVKGPGSFTGLRIGFAAAKALGLALGIPFTAIPTLDCLAFPLAEFSGLVLPVLDAKQKRFFTAFYKNGLRLSEYLDASIDTIVCEINKARPQVKSVLLTGCGANLVLNHFKELLPKIDFYIDPAYRSGGAVSLLKYIKKNDRIETADFSAAPLYIRKSDAEINLKQGNADKKGVVVDKYR